MTSAPMPEPKRRSLEFVSYSLVSNASQVETTLKVDVDGEVKTFSHNGGVGAIDVMCKALHDLVPGFQVVRCRTEELRPGSDAPAKAVVQIEWGGLTFDGNGEDQDTLHATAKAVVNALGMLRPVRLFTGGRVPEHVKDPEENDASRAKDLWAGFLINEVGGSRGKGSRDLMLFDVSFGDGPPAIVGTAVATGKLKRLLEKGYHHEHKYEAVKTRTTRGETCHLFVLKRPGPVLASCQRS